VQIPKVQKDSQVTLTLVKLALGLNFIDVLGSAFMRADPKSVKKTAAKWSIFFIFLGSTSVKAAGKMLVKLTLGVNFINVIQTAFTLSAQQHC